VDSVETLTERNREKLTEIATKALTLQKSEMRGHGKTAESMLPVPDDRN
jgi:hypothetical protein